MNKEIIIAVVIGIGLAESYGFRVFVPMLVASIAPKAGLFPLNEGFQWIGSWPAILCFGTATVVATGEHAAVIGTSILSLVIPIIITVIVIVLITFFILKFGKKLFRRGSRV